MNDEACVKPTEPAMNDEPTEPAKPTEPAMNDVKPEKPEKPEKSERPAKPTEPTEPGKRKRHSSEDTAVEVDDPAVDPAVEDASLNVYVQRMSAPAQRDMAVKVFGYLIDSNTLDFFTPGWKAETERLLHVFFARPSTVIHAGKK